jgi:hypothetical protein
MRKYSQLFTLILAGFASAGTYRVPEDEPIATIHIPEKWKTQQREEFVEATTPQGAAHVLVLPVEGRKIAESMREAMRYIRRSGDVKIKPEIEKPEITKLKGRQLRIVSWNAIKNKEPIEIRCYVLEIEGKPLLVVFWGSLDAKKKYQRDLNDILESIEKP